MEGRGLQVLKIIALALVFLNTYDIKTTEYNLRVSKQRGQILFSSRFSPIARAKIILLRNMLRNKAVNHATIVEMAEMGSATIFLPIPRRIDPYFQMKRARHKFTCIVE